MTTPSPILGEWASAHYRRLAGSKEPLQYAEHLKSVSNASSCRAERFAARGLHCQIVYQDGILRVAVPNEQPEIVQICGFFNASFGRSVRLFGELREPVIEQFEPSDKIDLKLREAMDELLQQEVGVGAMTASLLKQIVVSLVRRSLRSSQRWTERFSILADRQVTRAFADMVARPGAAHSVQSLAHSAGLSRSAFMSRFSDIFGRSPMAILRDLRMRQAAIDLTTTTMSIDVVALNAGYVSRSSFVRAFRKAYNRDPSDYRRIARDGKVQKDI
jgi:AraC family transcriptional activator of mtrCDE